MTTAMLFPLSAPARLDIGMMAAYTSPIGTVHGDALTLGVYNMPLNITKAEFGPATNLKFNADKKAPDYVVLTVEGQITLTRKEKSDNTMYYASSAPSNNAGEPNARGGEIATTTTQTQGLDNSSLWERGIKVKIGSTEGFLSIKTMFNRLKAATVTVDVAAERAAAKLEALRQCALSAVATGVSADTVANMLRSQGLSDDVITEWLTEPEEEAAAASA